MVTPLKRPPVIMMTVSSEAVRAGDDNHHHSDVAYDDCQTAGVRGVRSSWLVMLGSRVSTSRR